MINATTANPRSVQRHELPTGDLSRHHPFDGDAFSIAPLSQIDFVAVDVEPPIAWDQKRF